jgi:hypothetical protein
MIITKLSIPRRRFLQGLGATIALPLLDAMVPASTLLANTAASPGAVRRFGAIFVPMGAVKDRWTPKNDGAGFEFSPILKPLEPFRQQVSVVTNLNRPIEGTHSTSVASFLSGVAPKRTEAEDVRLGPTLDQIIADHIGQQTPFASLELALEDVTGYVGACDTGYSCAYQNTMCWRSATVPVPMETNPRVVFERLFGRPGTPAERAARAKQDASILDSVREDASDLRRGLGARDRARLAEYLDNVREIERRIQMAEKDASASVTLPDAPVGIPESFPEHSGLLFELLALAYMTDMTRGGTYMMAREVSQKVYPEIDFMEPHHHVSHHRDQEVNLSRLVVLQTHFMKQFASFVKKLRDTPDGDGTLLDHTLLVYGSGMSNSNVHSPIDIPWLTVGGASLGVKGDYHHVVKPGTKHANVLVDIANKFDVDVSVHGISDGRYVI